MRTLTGYALAAVAVAFGAASRWCVSGALWCLDEDEATYASRGARWG